MKKNLAGLLFAAWMLPAQKADAQAYEFSHFNAPYQELTNGTALQACNQEFPVVPLGFNFPFLEETIDSISLDIVTVWHEKMINGIVHGYQIFPLGAGYGCRINPTSEVTYRTVQENGSPVFIVQWKNLGFYNDTIGNQYINIQLKLYDSDKAIEVRFGDMYIVQEDMYFTGETGGFVAGIAYTDPDSPTFSPNCFVLSGDPANPVMDGNFNPDAVSYAILDGHPDSSMVYRFAPENAGINSLQQALLSISPNPANTDNLSLHSPIPVETIRILGMNGQQIGANRTPDAQSRISIADLEKGIYLLEAHNSQGIQTVRFIRN